MELLVSLTILAIYTLGILALIFFSIRAKHKRNKKNKKIFLIKDSD